MLDTSEYPLRIMAIDPGGTNGVVQCRVESDSPLRVEDALEERDMFKMCGYVQNFMAYNATNMSTGLVIVESWRNLKVDFNADANLACQPIGIIRWLARDYDANVRLQPPQERLGVTDVALKASGYWIRGGEGHMRQALKHALIYVTKTLRHQPTIMKLHPRSD